MKLSIVILAVLGLACGKSIPTPRNLQDDLNDFLALIPTDEILNIAMDYLANDAEVQEAVAYIQGDEFHKIVTTIEGLDQFANAVKFLQDHGLTDVVNYINVFNDFIGIDHWAPPSKKFARRTGGINGLVQDILAVLPIDEIKALAEKKYQESPDYKAFIDAISGEEFQSIISTLTAMPEYADLIQKLKDKDVDVDAILQLIKDTFGLTKKVKSARNLQDDLNDFLALIPTDEILNIAMDYLANDAEVQEAVAYIQGDEFHKIVTTIEGLDQFANAVKFLQDHGLTDVVNYINVFNDFIGIDHWAPPSKKFARRTGGINGLVQDILAVLPIDEIKALAQKKYQESPDYKAFIDAISGEEFQSIISTLTAMPEYADLIQKLKDKDVDVDAILQLIKDTFGLTKKVRQPRNLGDDLNDLLALIPTDEVLNIALDYLANDAEVQEAVAYIQGDSFHKMVTTVEGLQQFANIVKFLQDHGVTDVVTYINTFNDFVGVDHWAPPSKKFARRTGGINGLVQDLLAVLPVDEIKALAQEKLQSSPDYQAFIAEIQGEDFQGILSTLTAMPEYADLMQKLKDKNVDVDALLSLIKDVFGIA